jgi:serine/threonine protein kinase
LALAPLRPSDPPNYGPYRLQGRLGSGGMGVVYLAFGPDNMPVALKVLQPYLAEDEEYRARFVREVNLARLVDSPYVVRLVAAETEEPPLWMATEYVEGATLAHAVETNGPVPADRLRGLAADLAEAVAALHDVGLIHRDLKPANVVLAWSGPKLIDFGIAKQEGSTGLTQTGVAVGSVLWMSPETLTAGNAERASDVFGWGLCIACAGTGRPPFGTGDSNAVAFRIMNDEPDLRGLPDGMTELIAATLSKDPQTRPSATELSSYLSARESAQPSPVAMPKPGGGWTGPNVTAVNADPSIPAAPGTRRVSPPPLAASIPPPASEPPPERPRRRRSRALVLPLAILAVILAGAAVAIALVATADNGKNKAGPSPSHGASASASASSRPSGSPATTPPATLGPGNASLDSAEAVVMAAGYTPYQDDGEFWDPQAPINVILGTLTGSADGHSNWAFFFAGNRYIGHDAPTPSWQLAIQSRTQTVITLAYQIYGPTDPTCCPTGGTQTVRYQWNGSKLVPLDPIPSDDPTGNHR